MAATKLTAPPRSSQLPKSSQLKTLSRKTTTSPITKSSPTTTTTSTTRKLPTPYQRLVYAHLLCIPPGRITSYRSLSHAISTATSKTASARAVGGALRVNPFAPQVPCHRVIAASGYVGGFKGEWQDAPSGVNQVEKLGLLKGEGVGFDGKGRLIGDVQGEEDEFEVLLARKAGAKKEGDVWFEGPWEYQEHVEEVEGLCRRLET